MTCFSSTKATGDGPRQARHTEGAGASVGKEDRDNIEAAAFSGLVARV